MLQQMATARRSLRAGAATVALGLALAAAGCGGGGDSDTPSATTPTTAAVLTHQQLVTRANAACTKASDAVAQVPAATSMAELAAYADRVRAIGQSLHDQLSALRPPAGDRQNFAGYLDALSSSNRALASMKTAASGNDTDAVRVASEAISGANIGVLAARAGLSTCATATETPSS
jgi:hypothetical protein